MNRIYYQPKAAKQLLKIPERKAIRDRIASLASMPDCKGVKKLTNHDYQYRLRVGRYRGVF